jgi:hypothetical protein
MIRYALTAQTSRHPVKRPYRLRQVICDACFTGDYPTSLTDRDSVDDKVRQLSLLAEAS